jgi:hypothetical protein
MAASSRSHRQADRIRDRDERATREAGRVPVNDATKFESEALVKPNPFLSFDACDRLTRHEWRDTPAAGTSLAVTYCMPMESRVRAVSRFQNLGQSIDPREPDARA